MCEPNRNPDNNTQNQNHSRQENNNLGPFHLQTKKTTQMTTTKLDSKGPQHFRYALRCILSPFQKERNSKNDDSPKQLDSTTTLLPSTSHSSISSSFGSSSSSSSDTICDSNNSTSITDSDTTTTHQKHNTSEINNNTKPAAMRSTMVRFFMFLLLASAMAAAVAFASIPKELEILKILKKKKAQVESMIIVSPSTSSKELFPTFLSPLATLFGSICRSSPSSSSPVEVVVEKDSDVESPTTTSTATTTTNVLSSMKIMSDGTATFSSNDSSTLSLLHSPYLINETDYNLLANVTTQIGLFNPLAPVPVVATTTTTTSIISENHSQRRVMGVTLEKPQKFIPVLEAKGSSERDIDKDEYGHRRDTIPIANAMDGYSPNPDDDNHNNRINSAVFQFLEEELDDGQGGLDHYAVQSNLALKRYLSNVAHGIIVRINPGTLSAMSQKKCDDMLRDLSNNGVVILTHPDVMSTLGAKDSLVKIRDLKCGLNDTEVYYDAESFQEGLRERLAYQPRVIKQNRGSQGEGVWIVKLKDETSYCRDHDKDCILPLDTELVLMEAFDNHVEYHSLGEFIDFCVNGRRSDDLSYADVQWTTTSGGEYFKGGLESGAMVVDQRFLPRIVEGEVRCLMIGSELAEIVHKKPREGGLSATLQSGAIYTKYSPDDPKFAKLVKNFKEDVPHIMKSFEMSDKPLPLLWTVDYIYGDSDEDLHAGEINCSCPGITQQLHIVSTIAKVAYKNVFMDK